MDLIALVLYCLACCHLRCNPNILFLGSLTFICSILQNVLKYTWIEDCLKAGKCLPIDSYVLDILPENRSVSRNSTENSGLRDNAPEKAVSSSLQKLTSSERATTSDWMQIINEGGEMGVVSKGLHKKETEGGMLCMMLVSEQS